MTLPGKPKELHLKNIFKNTSLNVLLSLQQSNPQMQNLAPWTVISLVSSLQVSEGGWSLTEAQIQSIHTHPSPSPIPPPNTTHPHDLMLSLLQWPFR